ncbi:hypothetical protein ALC57_01175 [Trachymyrmex cornetzi]|uniref:Uncharacterized protein n=1 Tax=Trachymyrmex cornetzi TaxID=471704 RepID=A0A151JQC5_9HYME|nr:hypothetical protein ALC57_01175 [Trachymyrmex cornetzi]
MMNTLQTALAPLLIIGPFYSLGLFEYPLGQPRPFLSCLYILTTWSFFTYCYYCEYIIDYEWQKVTYWIYIIIMINVITLILVSYFHFKVNILKYTSLLVSNII